ncbi:MAG TPA: aspartate:alanine exchanger family transporter [Pyrinomonadaceae bacterium]|nr:aspartate:alanine exchanger family transporter [Pyrinomonadaceae bacterium]
MINLLVENPLLLLFVVAAIGYPLGRIKIRGVSLGVAAVLFAGLAVGSLHPDLKLPEIVYLLGQSIFIYTIGLSSGAAFFSSLRRKGYRDNLFILAILSFDALLVAAAQKILVLKPTIAAGLFAGSVTNTSALAGVLEFIKNHFAKGHFSDTEITNLLADPVVGFSLAYPMGVLGLIFAIIIVRRLWRVDYAEEAKSLTDIPLSPRRLHCQTILVNQPQATEKTLTELTAENDFRVVFGRLNRNHEQIIAETETRFQIGDLITICGTREENERVAAFLGEPAAAEIEIDGGLRDYYRVFVSNPQIVGHKIIDLNLPHLLGATVIRVRRGDVEFLPQPDTVLEYGDRVRVLAKPENQKTIAAFFGDSYRALSEIDILTFALGITAGLLLGMVPLPLPGGFVFKLGAAGGPLLVALILGKIERTGWLVWNIPYGANLTLRQIGLVLFLAGIGTRSGYAFVQALGDGEVWKIFLIGAFITCVSALMILWIGFKLLKIPMNLLVGMLAGAHTQPAVLGFALEQTGNELPNIGYASVLPTALIAKVIFAQLLLAILAAVSS